MKLTRLVAAAGLLVAVGASGLAVAAPAVAYPANTRATADINATVFERGGIAVVHVHHATPQGVLTEVFESSPVVISSGATVGANAEGVISGAIPSNAVLGKHQIIVNSTKGESFTFNIIVIGPGNGGGGNGTGSGGGSTTDNGNLASTGAAVTGIGILGLVLVGGGVFFVAAGRRRTAANQTPSV